MNNNLIAVLLGVFSFFLFSLMNVGHRLILNDQQHLLSFNNYLFYESFFGLLIIASIGCFLQGKNFFILNFPKMSLLRAIVLLINSICNMLAVSYLQLDVFYSIVFLMPIFVTIFGVTILKETLHYLQYIVILLAFIGMLLVIKPIFDANMNILGIIYALIVTITGAFSATMVKKYLPNEKPFSNIFYVFLFSFILSIVLNFRPNNISIIVPNISIILIVICISIITFIAATVYILAYQKGNSIFVAPTQYFQLLFGILFGYLFFQEVIQLNTLLGLLVIIIANMLNVFILKFFNNTIAS